MDTHKGLIEYDEAYKSTTDFMKHDNDESVEPLSTSIFRDSTRTPYVPELLTLEENHGVSEQAARTGSTENRSGKSANRTACALHAPFPA